MAILAIQSSQPHRTKGEPVRKKGFILKIENGREDLKQVHYHQPIKHRLWHEASFDNNPVGDSKKNQTFLRQIQANAIPHSREEDEEEEELERAKNLMSQEQGFREEIKSSD